jgi:hypothetical protein
MSTSKTTTADITSERAPAAPKQAPTGAAADSTASCGGEGDFNMPPPTKEHEWLHRFVGEWESEVEMSMGPDQPPTRISGKETARMLGGFWLLMEGGNEEMPYRFLLTLGYDPRQGSYVGSWVDSMSTNAWKYRGTVNSTGNILTLETEGPFPPPNGPVSQIREVTEFKSDDLRVFTSSVRQESGEWVTVCTITARRKK